MEKVSKFQVIEDLSVQIWLIFIHFALWSISTVKQARLL